MEPDDGSFTLQDHSDADLARTIAAASPGGAQEAEAELYRRLAPRVRLYGLRHLRDGAAATDLAQQVLLMTIGSLRAGRVREPERLGSFVLGACRMMVQDQRRSDARRQRLLDEYAQHAQHARGIPAAEVDIRPEVDPARLRSCLEGLAGRERSVVVMSFYADRSAERVGAELGLSPGNVRVVRHRALRRLRECLTRDKGRP